MSLPEHTKLKYEECYAKIILEHCFSQKYNNLLIEDKPDLYDKKNDIGIEVTMAIAPDLQEARNLWSKMHHKNSDQQKKAKERMHQLNYDYQGGIQNWGTTEYEQDIDPQMFKEIYEAIRTKLEKLNQKNLYKDCRNYALFIQSELNIEKDWLDTITQEIQNISHEYTKIYSTIYFVAKNDIFEIDVTHNKCTNMISFDDCQGEISRLACNMVKDGESHDKT